MKLAHERLLEILRYNRATGLFRWRKTRSTRIRVGDVAGGISAQGYIQIRFDGCLYLAHRLAVFYVTGKWPEHEVDHRDLNRTNNRWRNLRQATPSQNGGNRRARIDNTSGFKGVYWDKRRKHWFSQIVVNRKAMHLGSFNDPKKAAAAYEAAAIEHFGEFARAA